MSGEDATRILNFWEVIDRVDPLPDPWLQTARMCEQIDRLALIQIASMSGEAPEPAQLSDFMPTKWIAPPPVARKPQSREDTHKALSGVIPNGLR